jgi:hypothetical protein
MSQTSYSQYQAAGFAGLLADSMFSDKMSYLAEGAIPFGKPVVLGTDKERQVAAVGTGVGQGALVIGISVASHDVEQTSAGVAQYDDTEATPVLKSGRIWVETDDAVVAGAVANLKLSNGKFTDDTVAAGIEALTQVSAKFITGTSGAGLAIVEIK